MSSVSENTEDNSYPQQHQLLTEETLTDSTVVVAAVSTAADASAASSGVGTEQSATLSQTSCSDDDETSLNTNNESSSILDQLTCINSSEKGSNSSSLNGSVMLNVFSASGLPASRQDPASSSLPCNIPTTITSTTTQQQQVANTDSLLGTQLIWENKEITSKEDNHKKKKKEPSQEVKKLDDGERESIMAELKVKRVLQKAVCSNCGRTDTPTWRKGPLGVGTLCNACGIKHSTNALFLDSGTGALLGHRPFIKYGETGHLVSEFSTVEEGKTSEEASSSLATNSQTSEGAAVVAGTSGVSTPEKQKRTRGRPKGSSNKKKPSGPLETAVELPPPSPVVESQTPQLEKKRGRGRPRTKPLPVQPPTSDADQMVDEVESEQLVVGSGKGKRKRKADDDEYVPEEPSEKPIVVQTKPKQRKIVTLPVGSDAQVLSLQNIQKTFSNNSENCIYISSDYLMQCIEGFKLTIKQGSKKNNGAINRRITTDSLVYIFFFLEMSDLITCFSVCRHWHEYAKSDVIWKEIYRRSWGIDDRSLVEYTTGILAPAPSINWFNLVQARINIRVYSPIQQVHLMSQFYAIENKPKILACIQENLNEEITTKKNNPKI